MNPCDCETDNLNRTITLSGGRRLGFAEFGVFDGPPIFYFHGWPGSRLEPLTAHDRGPGAVARVIAVDRPGYGLSDFQPGRKITDWPADVCALADALELRKFAVLGVSGGGPYAAACAAMAPERVTRLLLVCSLAPLDEPGSLAGMIGTNRWMLFFARRVPGLARAVGWFLIEKMSFHKGKFLRPEFVKHLCAADQRTLADPEFRDALTRNACEGFRNGARGTSWDGCLYARPWGFRLQDIKVPTRVWHGEADVVVPPRMGRICVERIPASEGTFVPEEGHFSLGVKYAREILRAGAE